jgi:transcription initiation factor TFIIH subunit 2
MLISSPHLARSYHHLFPVPPYEEVAAGASLAAAAAEAAAAAPGSGAVDWHEPGGGDSSTPSGGVVHCYGCLRQLDSPQGAAAAAGGAGNQLVLRCGQCRQLFCFDCDAFVHEQLHNCPGCECGAAAVAPRVPVGNGLAVG